MRLSRDEAIQRLITVHKIDNRAKTIKSVSDNGLLGLT